jgi:hypothetical protein
LGAGFSVFPDKTLSIHANSSFGGFYQRSDSTMNDSYIAYGIKEQRISSRHLYNSLGFSINGPDYFVGAAIGYNAIVTAKLYEERFGLRSVTKIPNESWLSTQINIGLQAKQWRFAIAWEIHLDPPSAYLRPPKQESPLNTRSGITFQYTRRIFGYYGEYYKRKKDAEFRKAARQIN